MSTQLLDAPTDGLYLLVEHLSNKVEQRLQWRRDKVRELSVKGLNQRQIASISKVGLTSVNEDLQYLRLQAKDNITEYVNEYLPVEYENCLEGLNNILTEGWRMSLDGEKREKIQAGYLLLRSVMP